MPAPTNEELEAQIEALKRQIAPDGSTARQSASPMTGFDPAKAEDPAYITEFMGSYMTQFGEQLMEKVTRTMDKNTERMNKQQREFQLQTALPDAFTADEKFDNTPVIEGLPLTWKQIREQGVKDGDEGTLKGYLDKRNAYYAAAGSATDQSNIDESTPGTSSGRSSDPAKAAKTAEQEQAERSALMKKAMSGDQEAVKKLRETMPG